MITHTWKHALSLVLGICLTGVVRAQPDPVDLLPRTSLLELFNEARAQIAKHPESLTMSPGDFVDLLWQMADAPADSIPGGLQAFLEDLADSPENEISVRCSAIYALRRFHTPENRERMLSHLSGESPCQLPAAQALVQWGYWDDGSPVLMAATDFKSLFEADSVRAKPILEEAARSATPENQLKAARLLQHYGDTTTFIEKCHTILAEYLGEIKEDTDSSGIYRACDHAANTFIRRRDETAVPWLANGLRHPTVLLRSLSMRYLEMFAARGSRAAKDVIAVEAQSNPFEDIRRECKQAARELNYMTK